MTGITLISVSITRLRPRQAAPTLWPTPNLRRQELNSLLAPINSSFSLIERLSLKSAGKMLYDANGIHKAVLIKNLLDVSDDFLRSVAKANFGILTLTPPQ